MCLACRFVFGLFG
jgi:hypothetical protein